VIPLKTVCRHQEDPMQQAARLKLFQNQLSQIQIVRTVGRVSQVEGGMIFATGLDQ
jgi:hypothetical protein